MNKLTEKFKGCYTVEQYCDICEKELTKVGEIYGETRCKVCRKQICFDCRYHWNHRTRQIELTKNTYFDINYCVNHLQECIEKEANSWPLLFYSKSSL